MNSRVAGYRGLAESLARKYVGRNRAEYDDLVQEGLISVWQALERGVTPAAEIVAGRMQSYVEWLGAAKRGVPYEVMLPLDDFQNLSVDPVWDALP